MASFHSSTALPGPAPLRHRLALTCLLLGLLLCWLLGLPSAQAAERFASVHRVQGVVTATDPATGSQRQLRASDAVQVGEQIQAASGAEAVLRTDDAGAIAVRPQTRFVMEQFQYGGKADDRFSLRLLTGTLRLITGLLGVRQRERYEVLTPTATIGIRGTDYEPYVLDAERAGQLQQPAGTYNKVNRGSTVLRAADQTLNVQAAQVGFAPAQASTRSLLTALVPLLLESTPGFYLPGAFDTELEAWAAAELSAARAAAGPVPAASAASTSEPATPPAPPTTPPSTPNPPASQEAPAPSGAPSASTAPPAASGATPAEPAHCRATDIARQWLEELDQAIYARHARAFIDKFSSRAQITATVRLASGALAAQRISRDDMARSTFTAMRQLTEFSTQRPRITATPEPVTAPVRCKRIQVESEVLESGVRAGQRYQLSSVETFTLVLQGGKWLAVEAASRPR